MKEYVTVTSSVKPRPVTFSFIYPLGGPIHCWPDTMTPGRYWTSGPDGSVVCTKWKEHPGMRGKTGFLRFIHAFADQLQNTDLPNPFLPTAREHADEGEQTLYICHEGALTADARLVYAEIYLIDGKPVFKIFLDRDAGEAIIECYDERYTEAARMTQAAVKFSYEDEEQYEVVTA